MLCLHLYAEPAASTLDVEQLARYARMTFAGLEVDIRDSLLEQYLASVLEPERPDALGRLAHSFAAAKVRHPLRQNDDFPALPGEVDYERRRLSQPLSHSFGLLYDGHRLMRSLWSLVPSPERNLGHVHVVFTNQLVGTWDEADRRYHARVSIYGFPSLLSTTGLVEAPAKPREFYLLRQRYAALGLDDAAELALATELKDRFIEHDDDRLTEVMKGYLAQALAFHLWGDPFCPDRHCRLYNAHWQEEVIRSQLQSGEFCSVHQRRLAELISVIPSP
ncbi:MAG: hypothetical protein HY669_04745 [Chloroflexi bacterium]|nr:hypothetical protein [Chloroflexota bacterium]